MVKTTLLIAEPLRERLKIAAARSGRTVTDLMIEGAEWVLAREEAQGDARELRQRAERAREAMWEGVFDGPRSLAAEADTDVYGR